MAPQTVLKELCFLEPIHNTMAFHKKKDNPTLSWPDVEGLAAVSPDDEVWNISVTDADTNTWNIMFKHPFYN